MKIELKNIYKSFKNIIAVNNISLSIEKNQTLGLLGPNGCGKTTSIGMMLGLIKPTKGNIYIDNKDINLVDKNEILSMINFASPYIELPKKLTVKQNLEVYGRLYGVEDLNERIFEISEDLNLGDFLEKKTGELSSGQKNIFNLSKNSNLNEAAKNLYKIFRKIKKLKYKKIKIISLPRSGIGIAIKDRIKHAAKQEAKSE